ncbi:MAG: hypothetical protein AB8G96_06375 [Phycisphaerales bacterium]
MEHFSAGVRYRRDVTVPVIHEAQWPSSIRLRHPPNDPTDLRLPQDPTYWLPVLTGLGLLVLGGAGAWYFPEIRE